MSWSIKLTGQPKALCAAVEKSYEPIEERVKEFLIDAITALYAKRKPTAGDQQYQSAVAPYPNGLTVECSGDWNDDTISVHLTISRQALALDAKEMP